MGAVCTSETSVYSNETTRRWAISQKSYNLHTLRHKNLTSHCKDSVLGFKRNYMTTDIERCVSDDEAYDNFSGKRDWQVM
jgi:hypothetical protein